MRGSHVLVLEDERVVAMDIQRHLERLGYTVVGNFASAEDGLAFLAEADPRPDLVLTDIRMRGAIDGIEAAGQIRRDYSIPVVVLTALDDEPTLQRAAESAPFAYLIKPFSQRELRSALMVALVRHRLELQLHDRERLLSALFATIRSALLVTDADGVVEFSNARSDEILGLHCDPGVSLNTIVPESILAEARAVDSPLAAVRWTRETTGGRVVVDLRSHPMIDTTGEYDRRVWIASDVTEEVRAQHELRRKEEQLSNARRMDAIGRLAGGLAHDFNNLMTVIMGHSRLALDDIESRDDVDSIRGNIQGVYQTAQRAAAITRQLLTISSTVKSTDARVVFDETVGQLQPLFTSVLTNDTTASFTFGAGQSIVGINEGNIEQIVLNLVLNARDAMPTGGQIRVLTDRIRIQAVRDTIAGSIEPGDYVLLSVHDTGSGIPTDSLPRVFEPFFSTKESGYGSGLGLATVYAVVEEASGAIDVESQLGTGTTFRIYLPALSLQADRDA